MSLGNGGADYQQLNALKQELQQLQMKVDHQQLLLQQRDEEIRKLKLDMMSSKRDLLSNKDNGGGGTPISKLNERHELQIQIRDLSVQVETLRTDLDLANGKCTNLEQDNDANKEEITKLRTQIDTLKAVAGRYEREAKEAQKRLSVKENRMQEVQFKLQETEEKLGTSFVGTDGMRPAELRPATDLARTSSAQPSSRTVMDRQRHQLLVVAEEANRRHNELQNLLQGNQRFLDEVKLDYEEYVQTSRLERDAIRRLQEDEYQRLKQEHDNFKKKAVEDKRQLVQEQSEVVQALQAQFEEYRSTAEFLFNSEADKLEEKLNTEMQKYEQEISYIIKVKDQQFDDMMTSKDAKIMNLIEGTDFQILLNKHEIELEQVRKSYQEKEKKLRSKLEADHKRVLAETQKQIQTQELVSEKLRNQQIELERRITMTYETISKQKDEMSAKEETHLEQLHNMQRKVDEGHKQRELLLQDVQNARHRIIRLKMKLEHADDQLTVEGLIKKLQGDVTKLNEQYETSVTRYDSIQLDSKDLTKKLEKANNQIALLQNELERRTEEFQKLTVTFQTFLQRRIRHYLRTGGVETARGKRQTAVHTGYSSQETMSFAEAKRRLGHFMTQSSSNDNSHGNTSPEWQNYDDQQYDLEQSNHDESTQPAVTVKLPAKLKDMNGSSNHSLEKMGVIELERGLKYLRKFQELSIAYKSGSLKPRGRFMSGTDEPIDAEAAPFLGHVKVPLYEDLEQAEELYLESIRPIYKKEENGVPPRPHATVYTGHEVTSSTVVTSAEKHKDTAPLTDKIHFGPSEERVPQPPPFRRTEESVQKFKEGKPIGNFVHKKREKQPIRSMTYNPNLDPHVVNPSFPVRPDRT
eukprot:GILK01006435.1.p1 GENE.GILK01006435.1~~GILK01006435.1.p1  ORF type:complete len:863 (-),score=257.14 GILK01006435.1:76-2664(-)